MATETRAAMIGVFACILFSAVSAEPATWEAPAKTKPIYLPGHDPVSWKDYPAGYLAMGDRLLMHPVNVGDWPVVIGPKRELFIDDYLVAERKGLNREFHRAVKHPGNPVIGEDTPWEKALGLCGGGLTEYDEKTGKFRTWYSLLPPWGKLPPYKGLKFTYPLCYAESTDGVHWTRPDMGWYKTDNPTFRNSNIILWNSPLSMFVDPKEKDPNKKYKGFPRGKLHNYQVEGMYLWSSPDGIRWAKESDRCIILGEYAKGYKGYQAPWGFQGPGRPGHRSNLPRNGLANASPRWDEHLGKYVADVKMSRYPDKRAAAQMESDDLIHWSPPRMTMQADQLDHPNDQLYYPYNFCYGSMWLGLLRVFHQKVGWKQTDVQLVTSRDGRTWSRACGRQAFITLGDPNSWDADYNAPPTSPVRVGDELWFYYQGSRYHKRDTKATYKGYRRGIGLAKIRVDGFLSLNGGNRPGMLLTRPLAYEGSSMFVNADVAPGGHVTVAVRDIDNKPLAGYRLDDCVPMREDTVRGAIVWKRTRRVPAGTTAAIKRHVRLLFSIKNAKLYSFWIE